MNLVSKRTVRIIVRTIVIILIINIILIISKSKVYAYNSAQLIGFISAKILLSLWISYMIELRRYPRTKGELEAIKKNKIDKSSMSKRKKIIIWTIGIMWLTAGVVIVTLAKK
jgi:hypothetical protein